MASKYGDINQRTAVYAEGKMLENADTIIVLDKFGKVLPLPKNKAKTIEFRRPVPFTVSLNTLQEGVTPPIKAWDYEDVAVTIEQYGGLTSITDVVADTSEDPVLNDMITEHSKEAAETKERVTWGAIIGGTNVYYSSTAGSPGRTDVDSPISLPIQRQIVRSLKQQRATKITRMLSAAPKFGTTPVAPSFIAACSSDCEQDIRDMDGFRPVEDYATGAPLSDHEIGKVEGVRYIGSPVLVPWEDAGNGTLNGMVSTSGSNVDVYPIVYFGENAYGTVPLKGAGSMNPVVFNPNNPSPSDPLGQRGYVGWKMYFAALILNDAWLMRAEVGVTDLTA